MISINLASAKKCKGSHGVVHKYPASYAQCRDCLHMYNKDWRSRHAEQERARNGARYLSNIEGVRERSRVRYLENKELMNEQCSAWNAANPVRKARIQFRNRLRSTYGLSVEDYARKLHAQDMRCEACGDALLLGMDTHVDHCHATGNVRAILCFKCNAALGLMQESPTRLRTLADYIERFK